MSSYNYLPELVGGRRMIFPAARCGVPCVVPAVLLWWWRGLVLRVDVLLVGAGAACEGVSCSAFFLCKQHFLYFFPDPQIQGSFLCIFDIIYI